MDILETIEVFDCPLCNGPALLEEDGDAIYAMCLDCGAHTVGAGYTNPQEREIAAHKAAELWNRGKVIRPGVGE